MKRGFEEWSDGKSVNLTSDMRQYDLTELDPLATYDTRVQSQNLNGLSEFSAVEDFITFGEILTHTYLPCRHITCTTMHVPCMYVYMMYTSPYCTV